MAAVATGSLGEGTRSLCALADARAGGWCPFQLCLGCPPYFMDSRHGPILTEVVRVENGLSLVEFVLDGKVFNEWQDRIWPWLCCPFRLINPGGF